MSWHTRWALALVLLLCAACNHYGSGATVAVPEEGTPARDFLLRNQAEDRRYGSYSYLLFAAPATQNNLAQYRAAAWAFLALDPARELRRYIPAWQLHITYLPLVKRPPRALLEHSQRTLPDEPARKRDVDSLLRLYNYPRATELLSCFHLDSGAGPFIITSTVPIPDLQAGDQALAQDFSGFTPARLAEAMGAMLAQTNRDPPSSAERLREVLAHARDFWARLGGNVEQLALLVYKLAAEDHQP